jgi:hypothetical protein
VLREIRGRAVRDLFQQLAAASLGAGLDSNRHHPQAVIVRLSGVTRQRRSLIRPGLAFVDPIACGGRSDIGSSFVAAHEHVIEVLCWSTRYTYLEAHAAL